MKQKTFTRKRRSARATRRFLFVETLESRRVLASFSGFVVIDSDGDGVRDAGEVGVPGALIRLSGTAGTGQVVDQSTLTENDGSYSFNELLAGTYELSEKQPAALFDGLDSSTVPGAVAENDRFTNMVLQADQDSVENNFGELGLRPEYAGIVWFFASTNQDAMLRESIAIGEERNGDADLGESIRDGGTDVPPDTNTSPIAVDDAFSVVEDQVLTIAAAGVLANDTDADGDAVTARIVSSVSNGSLTLDEDGSFTYTPDAGFVGGDSFTYQADDGTTVSTPGTVTLTVTGAQSEVSTFSIDENLPIGSLVGQVIPEGETGDPILFDFADPELDLPLRLAADDHISGDPTAQVVLIEYLDLQCPFCQAIHPVIQQLEQDFDGELLVVRRHLPLTNIHPNAYAAARVAEAAGRQGLFDAMANLMFDRQEDWEFADDPQSLFESYATELGLDLVQLRSDIDDPAIDARINRDLAAAAELGTMITPTFYLNGQRIDNPGGVAEFTPLIQAEIDANDNVFALDRLTGEIFVADSSVLDFETTPTFGLNINVSNGSVSTVAATINLINVNEATPTAQADSYVVDENGVLSVTTANGVLFNDSDADSDDLTAILVSQASQGTVSLSADGSFVYIPNAGFSGSDAFTYDADDGEFSETATVSIDINPVNDDPITVDDQFTVDQGQVLDVAATSGVLQNDSDPDGDSITARLVSEPDHGNVALSSDGSFIYTPDQDYAGTDVFVYQADDGAAVSDNATVSITVTAVDQNTFSVIEGAATGTLVGQITPEGETGDPAIFEISNPSRPAALELAADDHLSGNPAGTVLLIEYLDFQCPACAAFHPIVAELQQDFADDLLVVRRHLPQTHIHGNAFAAAQAAEAAGRQGMFDEMGTLLFTNQTEWELATDPQPFFESYASDLGLDLEQLRTDMNDPAIENRIVRDIDAANVLAFSQTPTFYLGSQRISNPATIGDFEALIEAERDAFSEPFTINRRTGELFVANGQTLDFETLPTFQITISTGSGRTQDATIQVLDAAEGEHAVAAPLDELFAEEQDWLLPSR